MTNIEKIKIIKDLLEATRELNDEFQEGYDKEIQDGETLLKYLNNINNAPTGEKNKL